jgi:hypothetical protein
MILLKLNLTEDVKLEIVNGRKLIIETQIDSIFSTSKLNILSRTHCR